ncbi:MAG: hypothetical protein ACRD0A_00995 [Acidimicrobiales bacterium]
MFRALIEVFGSLGSVVVVLEDLHWADEHTVEFVTTCSATLLRSCRSC